MKRFLSLCLAVLLMALTGVVAFAADTKLVFESSYNADIDKVIVEVYVENPGEMISADLRLGFDESVYEYVKSASNSSISDMMAIAGLSVTSSGLASVSAIFTEKCEDSYLTDGRLRLATFTFQPLTEDYDINDFCLWAYSLKVGDTDISKSVSAAGNSSLKNGKTDAVTVADSDNTSSSENSVNGKWYVYVIAVVAGVAIVAGVAVIAVKGGEKAEKKEESSSDNE